MKALNDEQRAYIAGHGGMVGAAILRRLKADDLADLLTRTHRELDLADVAAVDACFATERPTRVSLAAAKVGGIWANDRYPAEFIYQNLMIEANVIHAPRFLAGAQLRCRVSRGLDRSYAQLYRWAKQDNCRPQLGQIAGLHDLAAYPRQSAVGLVHVTRPDALASHDPVLRKIGKGQDLTPSVLSNTDSPFP